MHDLKKHLIGTLALVCGIAASMSFSSCSLVNDDLDPCVNENRVKFTYTMNMAYADAFQRQVKSVEMYVFDTEGNLVYSDAEMGEALAADDYYMPLPVAPGKYDIIVWGGLQDEQHFGKLSANPQSKDDLRVSIKSKKDLEKLYHDEDLKDLFHGTASIEIEEIIGNSIKTYTIDLVKNTNRVNVLLHHLDGSEIDANDFDMHIESGNGYMNYDNRLISDSPVHYLPWSTQTGNLSRAEGDINYMLGEMTTARLLPNQGSRLVVTRKSDQTDIININLEKYLLLIKGSNTMDDEEFLNRQDTYAFQFILDDKNNWYVAGGIYINNWRVVPPQEY